MHQQSQTNLNLKVMIVLPRRFTKWEPAPIDNIKSSTAWIIRNKVNKGEKLTREEKNYIAGQLFSNGYFRKSIPVLGWEISFADVVKRYWVKEFNNISEHYAPDKTSLRNACHLRKDAEIVEIK